MKHEKIQNNSVILRQYSIKKGFTLIEVIVSIAILGIISIAFLSIFSNGLIGIYRAGHKSVSQYEAQEKLENNISNPTNTDSNLASTNVQMNLNFLGNAYNVSGRKVDVQYFYNGQSKKITTFTAD